MEANLQPGVRVADDAGLHDCYVGDGLELIPEVGSKPQTPGS